MPHHEDDDLAVTAYERTINERRGARGRGPGRALAYCLGFVFDIDMGMVLLRLKSHPNWQRGSWNGIGGEVKPGESLVTAMHREFSEEVRLPDGSSAQLPWHPGPILDFHQQEVEVHVFYATVWAEILRGMTSKDEDEPVFAGYVSNLHQERLVAHVAWLVPYLAAGRDGVGGVIDTVHTISIGM
jgi:8-oxo-dGTP pyrophosphatase MutT (NUDIX family)